jgi:hypothetical protein
VSPETDLRPDLRKAVNEFIQRPHSENVRILLYQFRRAIGRVEIAQLTLAAEELEAVCQDEVAKTFREIIQKLLRSSDVRAA